MVMKVTLKELRSLVTETWTQHDAVGEVEKALQALARGDIDGAMGSLQGALALLGGLSQTDLAPGERELGKALTLLRKGQVRIEEIEDLVRRALSVMDEGWEEPGSSEGAYRDAEDQGDYLDRTHR